MVLLKRYAFLYRTNTFGTRNWFLLNFKKQRRWKADVAKIIIICENNYQLLNIFVQCCVIDVWQVSEFASDSEYPRFVNIPLFCICQDSAYAASSAYARVFNIPSSEYPGVTQGSEYTWIFSRDAFYITWLIRYQGYL